MAGSDDSISSAASSGSDGEHSCPTAVSSSSSARTKIKKSLKRREAGSSASSTIRHRHRHKLSHRFEFVRTLGSGTYGKVKLAVQLDTREEVAIKCIPKSKIDNAADLRRLRQEIEVMSSLRHPHIIRVTEVFESKDKIVMVMEHAAGGELYDYINDGKATATEAKRLFRQIVSAVHYLHKNNIVHRDLKLENVLLDTNSTVKIADFGLSSTFGHSRLLDTFCGSPLYASPEIINGTPYHGPEVDCWSLGVILYAMVYKTMPFHGADFTQLKAQITGGEFFEPASTSDASDLIHRMLTVDPRKRITIDGMLSHPWLSDRPLPCQKAPEILCLQQQEILDNGRPSVGESLTSSEDSSLVNSLQETAKKPLAGILKRPLRRSTHRLGLSDSRLASSSGKERNRVEDKQGGREEGGEVPKLRIKKGILKKQVKDSGGDSGLGINESGQSKSNASLDSSVERDRDGAKEKNKRDSGIDHDLTACCLLNERPAQQQESCQLREPNRLNYVCKIVRRHSRGKYSRVAKMWDSIYSASFTKGQVSKAPLKLKKDAEMPQEHNSSSSNEDILGILDSPSLRTPTVTKKFQYSEDEVELLKTVDVGGPSSVDDQGEEESYTRDELMGAMDAELLEVYQKALKISQAVM